MLIGLDAKGVEEIEEMDRMGRRNPRLVAAAVRRTNPPVDDPRFAAQVVRAANATVVFKQAVLIAISAALARRGSK